jgi:hypothetical protein
MGPTSKKRKYSEAYPEKEAEVTAVMALCEIATGGRSYYFKPIDSAPTTPDNSVHGSNNALVKPTPLSPVYHKFNSSK